MRIIKIENDFLSHVLVEVPVSREVFTHSWIILLHVYVILTEFIFDNF